MLVCVLVIKDKYVNLVWKVIVDCEWREIKVWKERLKIYSDYIKDVEKVVCDYW